MKLLALAFSFLLLSATMSFSETEQDYREVFFKDWNGLVDLLRSEGVDPSKIIWTGVETACALYDKDEFGTDVPYNKCRFEKALNQFHHANDIGYCNSEASQMYYAYIKPDSANVIISKENQVISDDFAELSKKDRNQFLGGAFDLCMRRSGWIDPNNWQSGRRTSR